MRSLRTPSGFPPPTSKVTPKPTKDPNPPQSLRTPPQIPFSPQPAPPFPSPPAPAPLPAGAGGARAAPPRRLQLRGGAPLSPRRLLEKGAAREAPKSPSFTSKKRRERGGGTPTPPGAASAPRARWRRREERKGAEPRVTSLRAVKARRAPACQELGGAQPANQREGREKSRHSIGENPKGGRCHGEGEEL